MKQAFLFLFILNGLTGFSQKNFRLDLEENIVDTVVVKIDSILIIGAGSTPTSVFLMDVSDYMKNSLEKKGVYSEYRFLGSTESGARKAFDTISKKGYKAILFFLPEGTSTWDVKGNVYDIENYILFGRPLATSSSVKYEQNFNVYLCLPSDFKKIWAARLMVICNITKSFNALTIAKKTVAVLEGHQYLQVKEN